MISKFLTLTISVGIFYPNLLSAHTKFTIALPAGIAGFPNSKPEYL
jgi:hypothetical protein